MDQPEVGVGLRPKVPRVPNDLVADTPAAEAAEGGSVFAGVALRASDRGGAEVGRACLLSNSRLVADSCVFGRDHAFLSSVTSYLSIPPVDVPETPITPFLSHSTP